MRLLISVAAITAASVVCTAVAQQVAVPEEEPHTPTLPVGQMQDYARDSGFVANAAGARHVLFTDIVHVEDAKWIRVYFGDAQLPPGSTVRIASFLDGEVQELDAAGLAMWGNSSAYFNGDTVSVELVGGAHTADNHLTIDQLAYQIDPAFPVGGVGECGICGTDDRTPSSDLWTGRLLPAGCTASVWNEESCLVSAGHCIGGNMVVSFDVPNSLPNCGLVNPPVADQFPVTATAFVNGGVGNDWSVINSGTNNLGQKPYERYGELRPIAAAPAAVNDIIRLTGYGADNTCVLNQTQQTSTGPINQVLSNHYRFSVDLRGGNSGSSITLNDEIIGIATHCPCPNYATRIDLAAFAAARELCPPPDPTPIATGPVAGADAYLLVSPDPYGAWAPPFAGGVGPNEDRFNPAGAPGLAKAAFTAGTFIFSGGVGRGLLATSADWNGTVGSGNLNTEITSFNVGSDTNSDGVDDTLVSAFTVTAGSVSLAFDLTQHVENLPGAGPSPVAVLTQDYDITNNGPDAIDFELVRTFDGDLIWAGDFSDDSVGTGTNGSALERYVYQEEPGDPTTAVTLSSPQGDAYFGGKHGVDPDGPGGAPPYNFGTDVQLWEAFGVPNGWRNHIAGVGYDTDGDSGPSPAGSTDPFDGFIGLEIPVSLASGASTTVTIRHTWGSNEPFVVQAECPWDCDGNNDAIVSVTDLLALLGEYDPDSPNNCTGGNCDFDGSGCVDVVDLLKLLGHYDPAGVGCPQ